MKCCLFVVLVLMSSLTSAAISSNAALVVDADTHEVIYEKNSTDVKSIASITKLMTALVVVESYQRMDDRITITRDDVQHTMLHGKRTSSSLPVGSTFTRAELLHFMLMNSQNIAAAALARSYPGGYYVFVAAMNHKAGTIGMTDTLFVDSCGLQSGNKSTAVDLVTLTHVTSQHPIINDFSTSVTFKASGYYRNKLKTYTLNTTNRFVKMKDWNITLQKTGFTNAAGNCMVMLTSIGSRNVIMVVLDAAGSHRRTKDINHLKHIVESTIRT